jgi:hypothetical protein
MEEANDEIEYCKSLRKLKRNGQEFAKIFCWSCQTNFLEAFVTFREKELGLSVCHVDARHERILRISQ